MQPYVIRRGDYLSQIAHQFDFDADTVWKDPTNDDLRKLRPDPNILFPGDILHIPDQDGRKLPSHSLVIGSLNSFSAPLAPTAKISVQFTGGPPDTYASKAFVIDELENLVGLTTDGIGNASFDIPVTLSSVTVRFTDSGETYSLDVGGLDPINTWTGICHRLQNLGYVPADVDICAESDSSRLQILRDGLRQLRQASQQSGDGSASQPSAVVTPPATAMDDNAAAGSNASDGEPELVVCESCTESWCPDDFDSSKQSLPEDSEGDDAGLHDDGTLSDEAQSLLLDAHGC